MVSPRKRGWLKRLWIEILMRRKLRSKKLYRKIGLFAYNFEHQKKSRCFFNAQKGNFEHGGDTVDNEAIVRELAGLQAEQRSMRNDLKEIKNTVKEMSQKPARRWDNAVDKVISVMLGAITLYLMVKLGIA